MLNNISEQSLINLSYQEKDQKKQKEISAALEAADIPHKWKYDTLDVGMKHIKKAVDVLAHKLQNYGG